MNFTRNYLLVCENTILDNNNKITLVNVFDILNAPKTPVIHNKLYVVGNFLVNEIPSNASKINVEVTILNHKGKSIGPPIGKFDVQLKPEQPEQRVGVIVEANGITFPEFGEYSFQLKSAKQIMGVVPISIKKSTS